MERDSHSPTGSGIKAGSAAMTFVTICIAQFMAPFMLTSVGVALPSLGRDLGASAVQLGLVEQLYVLSVAMVMLTFGRLGDIVGQRRIFLAGLLVFTFMTFTVGFSISIKMVITLRFFQGLGAAMMLSGSLALVAAAYPPEVRGRKIGLVSACTYIGLSTGPVIGGYVTNHFGWRSVFLMVVPPGLCAITACIFGMTEMPRNASGERMDWKGALAYGLSAGLIMLGAAHAREVLVGPAMIGAGILGFILFYRMEARSESPLLDVGLLAGNRFFTWSCLAAMGNYAATFGVTFFMSLFLQFVKGLSPREAGLLLLLQPLMQVLASPPAGRLSDRFEPARLATVGMLVSSAGLLLAALTISAQVPLWIVALELIFIGFGFGIFITPNSTAIMASVERRRFGLASGMIGAMRTLGMAASMTTVSLIFSLFMGSSAVTPATQPAFLLSMRVGLLCFSVFSCLGMLLSLGRGRKK